MAKVKQVAYCFNNMNACAYSLLFFDIESFTRMLCEIISWFEICVFYEFWYHKVDILCIFKHEPR